MKKTLLTTSIMLSGTLAFGLSLTYDSYEIKSKYSENCLKTESSNAEAGSKLIQGSCLEDDSRTKFNFSEIDTGYFTISNENGLYLSVAGESKSNGINIILSTNPTQFKIEEIEGNYKIKDKNSSKYLTIEYTSNDIVQFSKHGSSDQLWELVSSTDNSETESIDFNGKTYNAIISPITGRVWLDRNLGADSVCTSSTDSSCYGGYYNRTDILKDGICPSGYKVPSWSELVAETIADSIQDTDINNDGNIEVRNSDTAFKNFLKLPVAGLIYSSGSSNYTGRVGDIWTTSPEGLLRFNASEALGDNNYQNNRFSVRCMEK